MAGAEGKGDPGPPELATTLMKHQEQGLYWMVQRERETCNPVRQRATFTNAHTLTPHPHTTPSHTVGIHEKTWA